MSMTVVGRTRHPFTKRAHTRVTAIWRITAIVGLSKHHCGNAIVKVNGVMTALANIRVNFTCSGLSNECVLSSRFVRSLRVLESQADEVTRLCRGLTKLEAGNRGIDGAVYGDSRWLLSGLGMTSGPFEVV